MLTMPNFYEGNAFVCKLPDGDVVNFYQMLPIYKYETQFKTTFDAQTLESLFPVDFEMVLNVNRENVLKYRNYWQATLHYKEAQNYLPGVLNVGIYTMISEICGCFTGADGANRSQATVSGRSMII